MIATHWIKAACVAFIIALIGALAASSAAAQEKVLKIGVLGVMKGPAASWGLVNRYSAETTAEMYNENGGVEVGGQKYRIQIVTIDDELDPKLAIAGAQRLIGDEKILAPFSWFIAVGTGGGTYWWMMARGGAGDTRAAALQMKPGLSS